MTVSRSPSLFSRLSDNDEQDRRKPRFEPPLSPAPSYSTTLHGSTGVGDSLKDNHELEIILIGEQLSRNTGPETTIEETPVVGHKIQHSAGSEILTWFINAVLLVLPMLFLVLAFLAVNMNGTVFDTSRYWVIQIAQIGPTIYPIMFAAIMGRLMSDIALYRAERGIRLGTVEQLVQGTSLAGSIKAAFFLRNRTIWGLLIILVWCFSPIGGQSSLRRLSIRNAISLQNRLIVYATGLKSPYSIADNEVVASTLQAAVLAPNETKNDPRDSWQNPKMPFLRAVMGNASDYAQDALVWHEFMGNTSDDYALLIGIPIWNLPSKSSTNFTMSGSFMYTVCQKNGTNRFSKLCLHSPSQNYSFCKTPQAGGTMDNVSAAWDIDWDGKMLNKTDPPTFVKLRIIAGCEYDYMNGSIGDSGDCITIFECDIKSQYIDINMTCTDGTCAAYALRCSSSIDIPSFITPWNEWLDVNPGTAQRDKATLEKISSAFPRGTEVNVFLAGSDQPEDTFNQNFDLNYASPDNVSHRITQFLNSYSLSSVYMRDIFKFTSTVPLYNQSVAHYDDRSFYAGLSVEVGTTHLIYKAHKAWVTMLTYISFTLIMCSIASIIMRTKTVSHDVLGYVSSLTRNSSYFEHCQAGSTLDGLERAHALQDTKVYIADVQPHMKIGRIALSTGITDGMPHGRLSKERVYE